MKNTIQEKPIEQVIKEMKAFENKVAISKEETVNFLKKAGILDSTGKLAEPYRS